MGFTSKRPSLRQNLADANNKIPVFFLFIITMSAIALFVQYDRMTGRSRDLRAKAYIQAATGLRIEAEEMTLSGNVSKDPTGTFLQF